MVRVQLESSDSIYAKPKIEPTKISSYFVTKHQPSINYTENQINPCMLGLLRSVLDSHALIQQTKLRSVLDSHALIQ